MKPITKITYIDYQKSEGIQQEIAALKQNELKLDLFSSEGENLEKYPTAAAYCKGYLKHHAGVELERYIKEFKPHSRILDIGVGMGQTSIYLASKGHLVSALEPSPELCEHLAIVANSYQLFLNIYCCNAESIDQIQEQFDLIIFNESLHHCDHPVTALKNCQERLVKGGKLLVANEPVLPFYRSKKWFYRRLQTHPQEMGHYGGNEHNYRYHEYLQMLQQAGFKNIIASPNISNFNPEMRLKQAKKKKRQDGSSLNRQSALFLKRLYYQAIAAIIRGESLSRPLLQSLQVLSLIPSTFMAIN
jgi:2-polyprenyl-3-methyl-5-hydroxy-6-metoxy-1,4-benzoquinol methylase